MEPKLLTEAEWRAMSPYPKEYIGQELRERGLIAVDPVDPLLKEADNMASCHHPWDTTADYSAATTLALAALRRGMELAQRPLTREMVREAWLKAAKECGGKPVFYDRLHAALTEMMKGEG
jgi:hypothetical protein